MTFDLIIKDHQKWVLMYHHLTCYTLVFSLLSNEGLFGPQIQQPGIMMCLIYSLKKIEDLYEKKQLKQ